MKTDILKQLKNGLIVSCQAEADSPFNSPSGVMMFAQSAINGGAKGIRSEGLEKTRFILENVSIPVIGLVKSKFEDGSVRITGSFSDVDDLSGIDCPIIAIDGTFRKRDGLTGPEFIHRIKSEFNFLVMADIATKEEATECQDAGADLISTTLNGYTPETISDKKYSPNFELIRSLKKYIKIPVIAEGRINSPDSAKKMIELGAFAVVVGTAITRPQVITSWFVEAMLEVNAVD